MEENEVNSETNKKETFKGTVVWFNAKKGQGFIARGENLKDIFVHYSGINSEGYKVLMAEDVVSFEEGTFKGRLVAVNVNLIERAKK